MARTHYFGSTPHGTDVQCLVLGSEPGVVLHLLTLGATVHCLEVTGGDGVRRNVALGHADPAAYLASSDYVGATIGRYANRVALGRFELDDREVQLGVNDRGNPSARRTRRVRPPRLVRGGARARPRGPRPR